MSEEERPDILSDMTANRDYVRAHHAHARSTHEYCGKIGSKLASGTAKSGKSRARGLRR
jgi:hypothetical protein